MGNAGSAHNLQNNCIQSELNLYYTQQYLRRATAATETKDKNQAVLGGWPSSRNVADCKVLPKPTENLKLRATTNGAILQAGGTISFRAKEPVGRKNEPAAFHPMRRCHTLILDGQNDTISKRKSAPSLTEFRRSQTLLFVGYNKRNTPENISKNFDYTTQSAQQNTPSSSSTLKVIKYNKKRKAPPAPVKSLSTEDVPSPAQNQLLNDLKTPILTKSRIYTTNNSKAQITQKQFQSPTMKATPLQRDSNVRTSENTSRQIQHTNSSYASKLPYRREKRLNAELLHKKETNVCSDTRKNALTQTAKDFLSSSGINKLELDADCKSHDANGKKKPARQQGDITTPEDTTNFNKTYHSDYLTDRTKKEEDTNFANKIPKNPNLTEYLTAVNERKIKYPLSRIPQLKRTFYFGMDSVNKSTNLSSNFPAPKGPAKMNKNMQEENDHSMVLNHKMDAEEEIVVNGILVHVRPTLPRRQLETPSFSPATAWRNLLEEQQCLQLERSKSKQNCSDQRILEMPICLKSDTKHKYVSAKANWTPQQDLDDDDDEEGKEVKKTEGFSNSLHIFSLSLPRDVHLQSQTKSSMKSTEQENNLKASNCWLVPGFNSLQKFKTQLGKHTDLHSNSKCTCASNLDNTLHNYQDKYTFDDSLPIDSKGYHQPYCDLNKASSKPTCYQNNNWLLHKSKSKNLRSVDTSKIQCDSGLKPSTNFLSFTNFQPKSLSNICSGKHIVYLPGQDAVNGGTIKDTYKSSEQNKTNKSNYKRQRQSQDNTRESLQDLTPIQSIHQSNVNITEKNTHRFSFQSTVRVLEKRRLAEKLSKDAEVQEAQRLNELEVMKRVEEDFQRKRAPEKANLRKQLRLHFKVNAENAEYRSLPLNINETFNSQISDANNNIFCRAEPDGAVSPSADHNDNLSKIRHSNFLFSSTTKTPKDLDGFACDGEESESETQPLDLQGTALLIAPYLNSII